MRTSGVVVVPLEEEEDEDDDDDDDDDEEDDEDDEDDEVDEVDEVDVALPPLSGRPEDADDALDDAVVGSGTGSFSISSASTPVSALHAVASTKARAKRARKPSG